MDATFERLLTEAREALGNVDRGGGNGVSSYGLRGYFDALAHVTDNAKSYAVAIETAVNRIEELEQELDDSREWNEELRAEIADLRTEAAKGVKA